MKLSDFLKTYTDTDNITDAEKIDLIANDRLFQFQEDYKLLSHEGRFELFIFINFLAMNIYRRNHPDKYEDSFRDVVSYVFHKAKNCQIKLDQVELLNFVNSRFIFFQKELDNISTQQGYMPGKLYSAFYLTPLIPDPEQSYDIGEVIPFYIHLTPLIKWVREMSNQI